MTTTPERPRPRAHHDVGGPVDQRLPARPGSGLAMLEAVRDGRIPLPPIAATVGFDLDLVEEGRAVFSLEPAEHHYNPIGSVHGGVFATLLDSATGCAVHGTAARRASATPASTWT